MSLLEPTSWTVLRALAVAVLALALGWKMGAQLSGWRGQRRALGWLLLLAPLCTPALLVSYGYGKGAFAFAPAMWKEAGYTLIVALRLVPIAALARLFFPSALSAEAAFVHRLACPDTRRWQRWGFFIRAAGAAPSLVLGLLFLLAFSEFELASLWGVKTWTIALFDAHAGGLALAESLRFVVVPLACQVAVLAALAVESKAVRIGDAPLHARGSAVAVPALVFAWGPIAALTSLLPFAMVAALAVRGVPALIRHTVFWEDFVTSIGFAATAAGAAWLVSARLGGWRSLLVLPGLLGGLVVSLLVLALFQQRPVRALYDTPVPLLLALVLLLLPPAWVLRQLLHTRRAGEALHLAQMLRHGGLLWELDGKRRTAAVFALFGWAYFDFTASSLLAPVGLTPVFVRLHNLAHYGQNAVLSAMLLAASAIPVTLAALTLGVTRLYPPRDAR